MELLGFDSLLKETVYKEFLSTLWKRMKKLISFFKILELLMGGDEILRNLRILSQNFYKIVSSTWQALAFHELDTIL